ncbi:uncharacterized protein LOC144109839 [Amblyomma americanum]
MVDGRRKPSAKDGVICARINQRAVLSVDENRDVQGDPAFSAACRWLWGGTQSVRRRKLVDDWGCDVGAIRVESRGDAAFYVGLSVNSTLDVSIADNAGLRLAFKAFRVYMTKYEERYGMYSIPGMEPWTMEQVFLIAYTLASMRGIEKVLHVLLPAPPRPDTKPLPDHHTAEEF